MSLANISERLYAISKGMEQGLHANSVKATADQAFLLEEDIKNFANEVEAFNSMESWTVETLPEVMQRMSLYVERFSRRVPSIKVQSETT
jgi:hypothetical protein